jgi:hypothetical protein
MYTLRINSDDANEVRYVLVQLLGLRHLDLIADEVGCAGNGVQYSYKFDEKLEMDKGFILRHVYSDIEEIPATPLDPFTDFVGLPQRMEENSNES